MFDDEATCRVASCVGEKHVIDVEDEDEVNSYHASNLKALHGADLVVCDEGHRIKNRDAIISMVLKEVGRDTVHVRVPCVDSTRSLLSVCVLIVC